MSVQTSLFPKTLRVLHTPEAHYGWTVMIQDGEGSTVFLSEAQADELAQLLWNRHTIEQKDAA